MSNISQQRLIEMEAEMDRFEQEILAQDAGDIPKVIIGSSTYNQVAAQLKMLRAASEQSRSASAHHQQQQPQHHHHDEQNDDSDDDHDYDADRSCQLDRDEPPPKKPALDVPLLPPPPPPPISMSTPFVPHQIRNRPPGPRPGSNTGPPRVRTPMSRPPYGGPMSSGQMPGPPGPGGPPGRFMPGPPRPGFGPMGPMGPGPYGPGPGPHRGPMGPGPGMGMPGPHNMGGHIENQGGGMYGVSKGESHASMMEEMKKEPEEEKPKVIYASAPVITKQKEPKKKKKKKKKTDQGTSEGGESVAESSISTKEVGKDTPTVTMPTMSTPAAIEVEQDDLHVADMEIDNPYHVKKEKKEKKKKFVRMAAGQVWEDQSLAEWENDDFRLFCGDLGNEVTDEVLARAFSKYPSFGRSKVIRDKRTNKTKGYGFVSFKDPTDYVRAMREMNGKYVGNRPIKLRKSSWKDRNIDSVKKKEKEKKRLGLR